MPRQTRMCISGALSKGWRLQVAAGQAPGGPLHPPPSRWAPRLIPFHYSSVPV